MEDNVALDSSKQKKFVKSIKKLIKKGGDDLKESDVSKPSTEAKKSKRKRPDRGLVYLSHIPHGFYEHQMTQYFKQFGVVTNVRVIRSKRTGNSKGYAFVEFREPSVAEIVAETMNNYLMGKRIIKAAYIPPEKQRPKAMRKHWSRVHNPGAETRLKMKKAYNENKDEKGELKRARKILSNLNKTKTKLSEIGIMYDFFTPVDVPVALQPLLEKTSDSKDSKQSSKKKNQEISSETKISTKNKDKVKKEVPEQKEKKTMKADKKLQKLDKNLQKSKEKKLKEAGVKSADNFIKIEEESGDSDSSLEFDSDEYEKMLSDDSDVDSAGEDEVSSNDDGENESDEDDDDEDDEGDSEELDDESEEEAPPPKKSKGKKVPIVALPLKVNKKENKKKQGKANQVKESSEVKRKFVEKQTTNLKKPKFEKQPQQPLKKQFKKKK